MHYYLADVFTQRPLAGNQLAVFTDDGRLPDARLMQAIALEMNLSETVFLTTPTDGGDARVRMFSTVTEVDFAGHPLLGTAVVLARSQEGRETMVRLETNVGIVVVRTRALGDDRFMTWMDQPVPKIADVPEDRVKELLGVLGLEGSVLPVIEYDAGIPHLYVMADSVEAVRGIEPDFPALGRAGGPGRPRVNVFALSGEGSVLTRMFSPFDRLPEDPACGSAAGPLTAHLARFGLVASGQEIVLSQGEAVGRPSELRAVAEVQGSEIREIRVGGGVCLVGSGELRLPGGV
ncbi:PhzF family phenazine biosynthesis protein [Streptomyces murinus]|uniref:PhzF family phenazine biosynthesis protein n=1 Tax=Streptomyces murinus TaxID=33900 RepID=UPI003828F583